VTWARRTRAAFVMRPAGDREPVVSRLQEVLWAAQAPGRALEAVRRRHPRQREHRGYVAWGTSGWMKTSCSGVFALGSHKLRALMPGRPADTALEQAIIGKTINFLLRSVYAF